MASLSDLHGIYDDAMATQISPADPNIAEAQTFLKRIEVHLWRRAAFYLDDPDNDQEPDRRFTKWADASVSNTRAMALRALILLLGTAQAETLTRTQILALSDAQIANGLNRVIPQMAYATVLRG